MEPQSSQPPRPDAKPGTSSAVAVALPQAAARSYPKPPPLWMRFLGLCLRPESWAETARYPTWVTLAPLLLAVVLGAAGVGVSDTWRVFRGVREFAAGYEAKGYPALEINSDGVLSAKAPLEHPIRIDLPNAVVIVDPTGKTTAESVGDPSLLVNDKEVAIVGPTGSVLSVALPTVLQAYGVELPAAGQTKIITKETMVAFLDRHAAVYVGVGSFMALLLQVFGETLWVLMMLFVLCPLVIIAAAGPLADPEARDRRLILPKRAAYRMAAGLLVPLVMLGAVLRTIGHPVQGLLGPQGAMLFWFVGAACLALWTGWMAKKMYGAKARRG